VGRRRAPRLVLGVARRLRTLPAVLGDLHAGHDEALDLGRSFEDLKDLRVAEELL